MDLEPQVRFIEELKGVEQALRESEEKYRVLFDTFPMGITVFDPDGNILETNATAERLLGISRNEHLARRVDGDEWRIVRPDGTPMPASEYASVRAIREGRRIENMEMGIVKPDGGITWLSVTAAPLLLEKYGAVVTYGDITERKRAEEDYQTLFREMLNGFALHEILLDDRGRPADYRFLAVNPAFERMTGLQAGQIVGRTVLEVMPETEPHWIETYGRVALTGEPVVFENFSGALGKTFEVTAFRPAPGRFSCIFSDITLRKKAEAEKARLQEQLTQAQKMESVGRLAGGVAHDFNNMLGVILGQAEMALELAWDRPALRSGLEEIQKAALRSADLTRQLLAFARKQIISPRVLNLNQAVQGTLTLLRRLIGENIELVWKPAGDLWSVSMDPSQVDQILANLCVNARDAISGVGTLTLETENVTLDSADPAGHDGARPGEFVLLSVTDTGCGMDGRTLDKLFEPFFTTKELGKGTGLGLATVYGIVRQNNGFVAVSSRPGLGTTFRIHLPRHASTGGDTEVRPAGRPGPGGRETILLVEDEPSILAMTRMMLERKGYRVITAGTPSDALALAGEHGSAIRLLVTDIVMPEMNGRELAGKIEVLCPGMKCLFMSGYTAEVLAGRRDQDRTVHFIQKPFSAADLAVMVRKVLDDAS
jgi:PAS domain S-box-containing protein